KNSAQAASAAAKYSRRLGCAGTLRPRHTAPRALLHPPMGGRTGCADASSSLWAASAEVKLRWVSVPAGGDHRDCAVVLALWLAYRDVEELLAERGIEVDHVTIYRW